MKEVYEFLKKCGTYYLATIDGDQPRVRPFGTIDLYNDRLYIQTSKVKDISKQLSLNPKAELCAFDGETWIRITATLVNDDDIAAKRHMLENYPHLKAMYDPEDSNTQVLYLRNATATFSSFTAEPRTVIF